MPIKYADRRHLIYGDSARLGDNSRPGDATANRNGGPLLRPIVNAPSNHPLKVYERGATSPKWAHYRRDSWRELSFHKDWKDPRSGQWRETGFTVSPTHWST